MLSNAFSEAGDLQMPLSLFSGATGIAWVAAFLAREIGFDGFDLDEFDSALDEHLSDPEWRGHYDLSYGLCGLGCYLLERPSTERCADSVRALVAHLECRLTPGGILTPPNHLHPRARALTPEGRVDLGMAHGLAGVVALLARIERSGLAGPLGRRVLQRAAEALVAAGTGTDEGRFPAWEGAGHSRSAWCYGDPGVASALLDAGDALGSADLVSLATETAELAASRAPESTSEFRDQGLCHGRAGLALIYRRLHRRTGSEVLGDAAETWLLLLANLSNDSGGIGGFTSWGTDQKAPYSDPTFLTGTAGVALALLSVGVSRCAAWDRCLLLDPLSGNHDQSLEDSATEVQGSPGYM